VSLADAVASLSQHVADTTAYQAEFERVWQCVMAVIDVEIESSAFGSAWRRSTRRIRAAYTR
jgi:hypothetical protein